jgi:hypothetical protein
MTAAPNPALKKGYLVGVALREPVIKDDGPKDQEPAP